MFTAPVYLVYPESIDKDHQERQDENPPGCGETPLGRSGERSACVDLTNYISLNAGKSVIHIDLRRARLEERHAAPSTQEAAAGKREKERSLWAWNYALLGDRHASLLITYELLEGSATAGEERTVTLHPDIANRIRGAFWGVIGLLLSLSLTILIGFFVPIQQQGGPSSSRRADESGRPTRAERSSSETYRRSPFTSRRTNVLLPVCRAPVRTTADGPSLVSTSPSARSNASSMVGLNRFSPATMRRTKTSSLRVTSIIGRNLAERRRAQML